MKKVKSCGIIVFDDQEKVLMVKHKEGHYGFPKGHVEEGETKEEITAHREVLEETNCDAIIIPGFREENKYIVKHKEEDKTVVFFVGRPNPDVPLNIKPQEGETEFAGFVSSKEAHKLLEDFPDVVHIFDKAIEFIEKENKNDRN